MLKYLRMDVYRLVHGKMIYVLVGIMLAVSVFTTIMFWWTTTPEFASYLQASLAQQNNLVASSGATMDTMSGEEVRATMTGLNGTEFASFVQNQSNVWLNGGAMGLFVSVLVALFFAVDFSSGFVKNLPATSRARRNYYAEKLVLVFLLAAVLFAVGIAVFEIARIVAGLTYAQVGSVGEVALWFGLAVVVLASYGSLTALVTWLTRSKAAGIAAAIVLSATLLEQLITMACSAVALVWQPASRIVEWLPYSNYGLLQQGGAALLASPGDIGHILITSGVVIVVCAGLTLGVCARRDV